MTDIAILQSTLSQEGLKEFVFHPEEQIQRFIESCSTKFYCTYFSGPLATTLLSNYKKIILLYSYQPQRKPLINNMVLSYLNLQSLALIRQEKLAEARRLLKKAWDYLGAEGADPILLSAQLSNLAVLYLNADKFQKALAASLRSIQILEEHVKLLLINKQRQKIIEDVVIMVNAFAICRSVLKKLLMKSRKSFYRELSMLVNYLGLKFCWRYLGNESIFTKRFSTQENQAYLPVFRKPQPPNNSYERQLMDQIKSIYDLLKAKDLSKDEECLIEEVYYQEKFKNKKYIIKKDFSEQKVRSHSPEPQEIPKVETHSALQQPLLQQKHQVMEQNKSGEVMNPLANPVQASIVVSIQTSKLQKVVEKSSSKFHYEQSSVSTPESHSALYFQKNQPPEMVATLAKENSYLVELKLNNWFIYIEITYSLKGSIEQVNILCQKEAKRISTLISENMLRKILRLLNLQDCLPYEHEAELLTSQQFIDYCILPYIHIHQDSNLQIHPRALGLLSPFIAKLFGVDCVITVSHIRKYHFRLAISPLYSAESAYLNIYLTKQTATEIFQIPTCVPDSMHQAQRVLSKSKKHLTLDPQYLSKRLRVKDAQQLVSYLSCLLEQFENFLHSQQQEACINEILTEEDCYFKYQEIRRNQGSFCRVRFLENISAFDIFMENNYLSYGIEEMVYAKGRALYSSYQLYCDLGVPIECARDRLRYFAEVVSKKFRLHTYSRELSHEEQDNYLENALIEMNFTHKSSMVLHCLNEEHYMDTIVGCVVSLRNEVPIGLKISKFSSSTCDEKSYFVQIVPEQWEKMLRQAPAAPSRVKNILMEYRDQFAFKKDYFLHEWMEICGFKKLLAETNNPASPIFIDRVNYHFLTTFHILEYII